MHTASIYIKELERQQIKEMRAETEYTNQKQNI